MKKILIIPLAFSLSFCNCSKSTITNSKETAIKSSCPENGNCTIQMAKNKNLVIKNDDIGSIYYELGDNPNTSVIHYQYERNTEEGLQDGQHREEILFEINNSTKEVNIQNRKLQETKMLFGRHCFCKGQAGYYRVEEGILKIENNGKEISINLDFKINKVPQLFNKIIATIK